MLSKKNSMVTMVTDEFLENRIILQKSVATIGFIWFFWFQKCILLYIFAQVFLVMRSIRSHISLFRLGFTPTLITCVIAWSNPRKLLPIWREKLRCHITMTSHNDPRTWCHECKVRFLLKRQTSVRTTPRTRALITLRDDRHFWTDRTSLTGTDRQWVRRKFGKLFLYKLHLKCIQNVWIAVINDNNNFAPSLFRSLCEFGGDCFEPRYFSEGASDFTQWPQKRWCQLLLSN